MPKSCDFPVPSVHGILFLSMTAKTLYLYPMSSSPSSLPLPQWPGLFAVTLAHTHTFSSQGSCTCCSPCSEHFSSKSSRGGSCSFFRSNAPSLERPSLTTQAAGASLLPSLSLHPNFFSSQPLIASEVIYLLTCSLCFVH